MWKNTMLQNKSEETTIEVTNGDFSDTYEESGWRQMPTGWDYEDAKGLLKVEGKEFTTVFDNYITVDGIKIMDGDKELKFVSLNYPQATTDNKWEQGNAIKTFKEMGGNVTRTYTIGVASKKVGAENKYVQGVDSEGKVIFDDDALTKWTNEVE